MPHVRTPRLATLHGVRYFICPNCKTRALDDDGMAGMTQQPVGCEKCGFGYLFELLEDFFPPAGAGHGDLRSAKRGCSRAAGACSS